MKSCVTLFSMDENSFPMSYPDDTNYIIFQIVENFKNYFFQIKKYSEG